MIWMELAAKAKAMLPSRPSYGTKQKSMADAASSLGLTRQSLRNIIAAHDFILGLQQSDEAAYQALSETPYSAVEIYSRWAAYDRKAALAHAIWARKRGASVKSVIADEKAARSRARAAGASAGHSLEKLTNPSGALFRLRRDVSSLLANAGAADLSSNWASRDSAEPLAHAMMVRHVLTPLTGEEWDKARRAGDMLLPGIGLLELGERSLAESYRKDAKDFLAKAIAATTIYALVLVVAPNENALMELIAALPHPYGQRHSHDSRAQLIAVRSCLGSVMFTSWTTIERDLASS
jgi:hypothetical protein